jgi:hypothetical protein
VQRCRGREHQDRRQTSQTARHTRGVDHGETVPGLKPTD